ncbi:MAG: hypothetical protein DSZ21_02875 [Tenericutes bacterium]|nr:MAG: hypothetical protein DSZ21_02875 [Mycoplasmatota bacterium]
MSEITKVKTKKSEIQRMIIDHLESLISDEMILNSFVRDLKVVLLDKNVVLKASSESGAEILNNEYKSEINQAVLKSYKEVPVKIIFNDIEIKETPTTKSKGGSKNISPKFTFDNYVESTFNKEAIKMAKRIIKSPGEFSPLYINSKSGLGKTHLLHAIGNEATLNSLKTIYIDPNAFTGVIQKHSLTKQYSKIDEYIKSFDEYDIILFDDIQNLGDRSRTLDALLTIIKKNKDKDKQIVIVSDRVAQELSGFEPQFITRFSSGLTTMIKNPEISDLIAILKYRISSKGMDINLWDDEALEFIARNHSTSIRALDEGVNRVLFFTDDDNVEKYNKSLMSRIFKDKMLDSEDITVDRILRVVASEYKLTVKDLIGNVRKKEFVTARHMAIYLIHKLLHFSLSETAKVVGNRHHTTISHAIDRINKEKTTNKSISVAISRLEAKVKGVS